MRVFNIYRFNIADKVKFKDAQSYIQNMLSELGLGCIIEFVSRHQKRFSDNVIISF